MNELVKVFNDNEFGEIRTININGKVWFIGNDIAKCLEYEYPKDAVKRHCKSLKLLKGDEAAPFTESPRGINAINEYDVLRLIVNSKMPKAEQFEKMIFEDIVPSVLSTGAYMTSEAIEKTLNDPDFIINLANKWKEERAKVKSLEKQIEEEKPLIDFVNRYRKSDKAISITKFANRLSDQFGNVGRNRVFKILRELKALKQDNSPYQDQINKGFFKNVLVEKKTKYGSKFMDMTLIYPEGQLFYAQKIIEFSNIK